MSNSVFQSVMLQLKDAADRVFGVVDADGCVVSCTDTSFLGAAGDLQDRLRPTLAQIRCIGTGHHTAVGINHAENAVGCISQL